GALPRLAAAFVGASGAADSGCPRRELLVEKGVAKRLVLTCLAVLPVLFPLRRLPIARGGGTARTEALYPTGPALKERGIRGRAAPPRPPWAPARGGPRAFGAAGILPSPVGRCPTRPLVHRGRDLATGRRHPRIIDGGGDQAGHLGPPRRCGPGGVGAGGHRTYPATASDRRAGHLPRRYPYPPAQLPQPAAPRHAPGHGTISLV